MFNLPTKMAGLKTFTIALAMVLLALLGQRAAAIHHHVVGDDLAAWASSRVFRVGDNIWFANTASKERLVELESVDEFSSCDVTNPIKMSTEDITKVSLDGEGSRYFVSSDPESCKKGLKLHINVHPYEEETNGEGESSSENKGDVNPHGSSEDEDVPDVPEPPPSPKPKPKPPHKAPPPEFDPDVGPDSPPEPDYPTPDFPPPTPSSSALLNGVFLAVVALACWFAI